MEKIVGISESQQCDTCQKLFGISKNKKRVYKRRIIDPVTNKLLVVCNACGLLLRRACWKSGRKSKDQVAKNVWDDVGVFVSALQTVLEDGGANRLYCPVVRPKVCNCIQSYITECRSNKQVEQPDKCEDLINKDRAIELNELHKKAKNLVKVKTPCLDKKNLPINEARGIIHLRSKEYEEFVLRNRETLKQKYSLCERAVQRVLCYSNNYLHKQLKTSPNGESRIPGKNALAAKLADLKTLYNKRCCNCWCTRLVLSHPGLVKRWRSKALRGQIGVREVLGEMLTPAGGGVVNCATFLQLVTGCSEGLLYKVKREMKLSAGVRDPPEHGLREYWRVKKLAAARNRFANATSHTTHTSVITRNVIISNETIKEQLQVNEPIISQDDVADCVNNPNQQSEMPSSTSNVVSVISSTNIVVNENDKDGLDSSATMTQQLLSDFGYIQNYSDEIKGAVDLQKSSGDLLSLNLLPATGDIGVATDGRVRLLPPDFESSVAHSVDDADIINDEKSEKQNVQYIEITKLSDLPAVDRNEDEQVKYVFVLPSDCFVLKTNNL